MARAMRYLLHLSPRGRMKRGEHLGPAPAAGTASTPAVRVDSGVRERVARTNLGYRSTRFVGRRRELSELRTLLSEHAVVAVEGPPGAGKTRLASELARALLDEYVIEGGAWSVDLSETRDVDGACAAIARTLTIGATSPNRSPVATIAGALAARGRTLVVLDAADGCLVPLARALGEWTREAQSVRWIVTSRVRPGAPGEGVLGLGPLATAASGGGAPDAVWLFVDRARAARPDLPLDEGSAQQVLDLVRRLEGLPLAIELAAARARELAPAQILQQAARPGDALRASIASTWDLLDPVHRDALAQLSIFAGGFDADAAAAVLDLSAHRDAPAVGQVLDRLRVAGLIAAARHVDGAVRFSLDPSVRQHARERLRAGGGRHAAQLRHARHYVAFGRSCAERCDHAGARDAMAWLAREAENLLAVHRRLLPHGREGIELATGAALALDPLLAGTGPATVRTTLLDAVLAAAEKDQMDVDLRIAVLEARSDAHRSTGRGQEATADAQAALSLATASGSRAAVGRVLRGLGTLAVMQGRVGEGRALLERAYTIDREAGHRREEGRALGLLGSIEAIEGRLEAAASTLQRAIAIHHEVGDVGFEALDTGNLSVVAHDAARLDEARSHCERALLLCREADNHRLEAEIVALVASIAHDAGRLDEARDLYALAVSMHRETGNRHAEGIVLGYQGALLWEVDDFETARAACARSLTILRDCHDRVSEAFVLGVLAALEAREGSLESARAALARASECLEAGSDEPRSRTALQLWRGHLELGLAREARAEGDEARATMLRDAARHRLEDAATPERGEVRRAADVRLARRALRRAIEAATRGGDAAIPAATPLEGPPPDAPHDALVVCAHGRWFRAPQGEVVSMARWRPLQRLLERLAERREIAPGEPLSVEALVSAGWPGERMLPKAGATRVYTAIASLRRLGLRDYLMREERGYLLRIDVPIARTSRR